MNPQTKSFLLSKTLWGIVVSAAAAILGRYVPALTDPTTQAGIADQLVTLAGAALAIYGRCTATQPLHVTAPPASN
jgi:hypothetical protein